MINDSQTSQCITLFNIHIILYKRYIIQVLYKYYCKVKNTMN